MRIHCGNSYKNLETYENKKNKIVVGLDWLNVVLEQETIEKLGLQESIMEAVSLARLQSQQC